MEPRSSSRDWIVDRVGPTVFEQLSTGLSGPELQSLLLEVTERRARAKTPTRVLAQYERDRFCAPSPVDLRTSLEVDVHLLAAAERFEGIELSPVTPLGTCSTIALTTQNRILTALRATEVVSDPTNVLALECASRWRAGRGGATHLATSQRVVRAQPVPKVPGYAQHFRIFVLASGGTESKDHGFTVESVVLHIRTMLAAVDRLQAHGYTFGDRRVDVLTAPERRAVGERVVAALGSDATQGPLEHAYYSGGLRYQIWVTTADGESLPLIDGGTFDWLATLTSNRRAVFVASGMGAQLVPLRFRRRTPT